LGEFYVVIITMGLGFVVPSKKIAEQIVKNEISHEIEENVSNATPEQIEAAINTKENLKKSAAIAEKSGELGKKIKQSPSEQISENVAIARGLGALSIVLENSSSFLRIVKTLFYTLLTSTAILALIILALIVILVFSTGKLLEEIPKLRSSSPEIYCSIAYRIHDKHPYGYCGQDFNQIELDSETEKLDD